MKDEPHARILRERLALANASPRCGARRRDGRAMPRSCDAERALPHAWRAKHRAAHARRSGAVAQRRWKHGHYSAEAKRVRRDARQQYRLLRQLIAAGNEDDVLDLISSM